MLSQTICSTLLVFWILIGPAKVEASPVLLWGVKSPERPALGTIQQEEFANLLKPFLKEHMIVAFLEKKLTTKDFLCKNPITKQSCYMFLTNARPRTYYVQVEDPAEALRLLTPTYLTNSIGVRLKSPIICQVGAVNEINFIDHWSSRAKELQAHDTAIAKISTNLDCPVVYLYMSGERTEAYRNPRHSLLTLVGNGTNKVYGTNSSRDVTSRSSHQIVRRQEGEGGEEEPPPTEPEKPPPTEPEKPPPTEPEKPSPTEPEKPPPTEPEKPPPTEPEKPEIKPPTKPPSPGDPPGKFFFDQNFVLYYENLTMKAETSKKKQYIELNGMSVQKKKDASLTVTFSTDKSGVSLDFVVFNAKGYDRVKAINYDGIKYKANLIEMPENFSYTCGDLILHAHKTTLIWTRVQFQRRSVRSADAGDDEFRFGKAWHCVGYFTIPILMGLFVITILISILFCGVSWLMGINTGDRFEDPDGQEIKIYVSE